MLRLNRRNKILHQVGFDLLRARIRLCVGAFVRRYFVSIYLKYG
jgi:hypothetical protein